MTTKGKINNKKNLRKASAASFAAALAFLGSTGSATLPLRVEAQSSTQATILDPYQRVVDETCLKFVHGALELKKKENEVTGMSYLVTDGKSNVRISLSKNPIEGPNLMFYSEAEKIVDIEYTVNIKGTINTGTKNIDVNRYYVTDKKEDRIMYYSYEENKPLNIMKTLPQRVAHAAYALRNKEFRGGVILPEGRIAEISFPDKPAYEQKIFADDRIQSIGMVMKIKIYPNAEAFKERDKTSMQEAEYALTKNGEMKLMRQEF